jgi:raffinose/stachyose/melibiose transport system permease protein
VNILKKIISNIIIYTLLIFASFLVLYPVYLMVVTSLKSIGEVTINPLGFPAELQWGNYYIGLVKGRVARTSLNSLMYTALAVFGIITLSSPAAYVVSRFSFTGNKLIKFYFISGLMVPFQVAIIPLFKLIKNLNLFNNMLSVTLVHVTIGIPFALFLYTGYLKSIPRDIEESAYIDGCNYYMIFWRIIFPLALPATATITIFKVMIVWNDFFIPLLFITNPKLKPVQLAIYAFFGEYTSEWHIIFACMTMASIPVVIIYLFLQRYFISGIVSGAVKG